MIDALFRALAPPNSPYFKRCWICHDLFPSALGTINAACSACQKRFKSIMRIWIKQRNIPLTVLDVFDKDGRHRCRSCGEILKSKAKYCSKPPCQEMAMEIESSFNWRAAALKYIHQLNALQHPKIVDKIERAKEYCCIESELSNSPHKFLICERCNALCTLKSNHFTDLPHIGIHHRRLVKSLPPIRWELLFDQANLIALCPNCYGCDSVKHVKRKRKTIEEREDFLACFRKMEYYFERHTVKRRKSKRIKSRADK